MLLQSLLRYIRAFPCSFMHFTLRAATALALFSLHSMILQARFSFSDSIDTVAGFFSALPDSDMAFSTCSTALSISTSISGSSKRSAINLPFHPLSSITSAAPSLSFCSMPLAISSPCWIVGNGASRDSFRVGCNRPAVYSSSRIGEGAGLISLFLTRNSRCFAPDRAFQCDQARKRR